MRKRLAAAADALERGLRTSDLMGLLSSVGYQDGKDERLAERARILRAASKLRRIFRLEVPDAPGLVFFGGEADPVLIELAADLPVGNLAGSGISPQRAFESCVGEGVEYLSQFARPDDRIEVGPAQESANEGVREFVSCLLKACAIRDSRPIAYVPARSLTDADEAWFPADVCLRRVEAEQDFAAPWKLSTGCAAGPSLEAATLRAILELVERDAVALWWRGGRRGRVVPPDSEAGEAGATLWRELRQGMDRRRQWLLDITTDVGVPVVAALSANQDGFGFAFGFGARLHMADAVRAAIYELSQVELGQHVIAAKRRESEDAALGEADRKQLRRATLFDSRSCVLLQGVSEANSFERLPEGAELDVVLERLDKMGIAAWRIDLTRPEFGIPVARVLAPGLQLEPSQVATARLACAIAETGGGGLHTGGLPLL